MIRRLWILGPLLFAAGMAPWQASDRPADVTAAERMRQLKSLAGDWVRLDADGRPEKETFVRYRVIAGGFAVVEQLGIGQRDETLTVYHLDGPRVLATQYGAFGNQPRLVAVPTPKREQLELNYLDGTNLDARKDDHIHRVVLRFAAENDLRLRWEMHRENVTVRTFDFRIVRATPDKQD